MTEDELCQILLRGLKTRRGLDLSEYRQDIYKKLIREHISQYFLTAPEAYIDLVEHSRDEENRLIDALLVKFSTFFRDPLVFEIIENKVLVDIFLRKKETGNGQIRIWSAGCADGEEPFSIAILMEEALHLNDYSGHYQIFGTDINPENLKKARTATFQREVLDNVKLGVTEKYFTVDENGYGLIPELKAKVQFSLHDLTDSELLVPSESIFGGFDLVFCRNVLIYFSLDLQLKVIRNLIQSLSPGGYLVLGIYETVPFHLRHLFETIDSVNNIFQLK